MAEMSDRVRRITITDVGESRRVVVDGQEYVLLHDAYQMTADARADERERIALAIEKAARIARTGGAMSDQRMPTPPPGPGSISPSPDGTR